MITQDVPTWDEAPALSSEKCQGMLGRVQTLVRAFGVLDEIAKAEAMSLTEIAQLVNLPRSTTHRLLSTMQALRYVEFDRNTNRWRIGIQALAVGGAFAQARDFGQLGRSIMRSLFDQVHHCVNIAVPENFSVCYVGQVGTTGFRQASAKPGAVLPLHTTASGKALMAHWPQSEFDRYLAGTSLARRTSRTLVDPAALRDELQLVRRRGYATDDEEHEDGLRCVAAVVQDQYGVPKASLSVSDRISELTRSRLDALGPTLVAAARQMSDNIRSYAF